LISDSGNNRRILISFLGNINYDTRARNLCTSLIERGFDVDTVSFDWFDRPQGGDIPVVKLTKGKSSAGFYLKFAFTVILKLLFNKYDLYIAADIYNLPFLSFFAKFRCKPLFYDSRELFRYLAGLTGKKNVQALLSFIEESYIKDCDKIIVTGMMDAGVLIEDYGLSPYKFILLRNLPRKSVKPEAKDLRKEFNLSHDAVILIYQGVVVKGRGLRKIIELLPENQSLHLIILGEGELRVELEKYAGELGVASRVIFAGTVTQDELLSYTAGADIGCTLIENISKSYYYALPNKLFEYVAAGIPVLASDLPQMKQIIDIYGVGKYVNPENRNEIIEALNHLCDPEIRREIKLKSLKAAEELNWEREFSNESHNFS